MEISCGNGHVWTGGPGADWLPEVGALCDCGKKRWGVKQHQVREHEWEFYMNGTFCKRCGAQIGSGTACR